MKLANIPKVIIACILLHPIAKYLSDPDFPEDDEEEEPDQNEEEDAEEPEEPGGSDVVICAQG